MNEISWQNFMMMNLVIPTGKSSEGGSSSSGDNKGMLGDSSLSLFDIGMRLQEGKGV